MVVAAPFRQHSSHPKTLPCRRGTGHLAFQSPAPRPKMFRPGKLALPVRLPPTAALRPQVHAGLAETSREHQRTRACQAECSGAVLAEETPYPIMRRPSEPPRHQALGLGERARLEPHHIDSVTWRCCVATQPTEPEYTATPQGRGEWQASQRGTMADSTSMSPAVKPLSTWCGDLGYGEPLPHRREPSPRKLCEGGALRERWHPEPFSSSEAE